MVYMRYDISLKDCQENIMTDFLQNAEYSLWTLLPEAFLIQL